MRSGFQNFVEILSWFEPRPDMLPCRPDGRTSAARNFHIEASRVRTKGMVVQTVDLMHAISIYDARASGPWRLTSRRLNFECDTYLMNERIRTGIHISRTVATIFPYLCSGKKSHSWLSTECRSDVLLKRLDGCKLEQFEASQHRGRSGRIVLVVRTDDALDSWTSGRYIMSSEQMLLDWWASEQNTMSSGQMKGIWLHCLEIRTESSRNISLKRTSEN
jgi:hypothetical protein